ncbi:MAG: AraC family transcriptional regulator [Firmicutes bacterium]|nr:AraC family transcriptional regulator [Bacillota bacterium]
MGANAKPDKAGRIDFYRDPDLPFLELKLFRRGLHAYRKHSHEEYSLGLVEAGSTRFWFEGRDFRVDPGELILIPPQTLHSCSPQDQENWSYCMFFIQPGWVQGMTRDTGLEIGRRVLLHPDGRMVRELVEAMVGGATPLEKEEGLISVFSRILGSPEGELKCEAVRGPGHPRLKQVKELLDESFLDKVTLDTLERVSGLNRFYLVRAFKAEYNLPPHAYQTLLRVNYAKRILLGPGRIPDIAINAGFYDQSHFTKVFKQYTGVTPESYQKSI